MVTDSYELVVIGAGSAGLVAAGFAGKLGTRVLLVEGARIGGDCTWTGCIPSKALLHVARTAHLARSAARLGLPPWEGQVELGRVMSYVRAAVERVYAFETPEQLRAAGVEVCLGQARFLDPNTLDVDGLQVKAERFLICTGAEPVVPAIPGLNEVPYLTYENAFSLEELPQRLLVLGAGPVGVELAQAFSRLGSKVILVEAADRILTVAEPEASELLTGVLREEEIQVRTGTALLSAARVKTGIAAQLSSGGVEVDAVLLAAGRKPRLDGLGLERAGIEFEETGIKVDSNLRTRQDHIYAAGDVVGSFQFTHYAAWQGYIAARNALLPGRSQGVLDTVPWTVFTDPAVAQAGFSEAQARAEGWQVQVHRWPMERIDRAQTEDRLRGFIKLIARDGKVVGATVVGGEAGEVINLLALAIEHRISLADLARTIHTYPTYSFGVQHLASQASLAGLLGGVRGRVIKAMAR